MTKVLTFSRACFAPRLMDELLAGVPALRPVDGRAVFTFEHNATMVRLTVPDAADEAAITAIVNAHNATPDPLYGEKQDARVIRLILTDADFDAYMSGTPTAAQTVVVVRKAIAALRALARIERNEAS